MLLMPSKRFCRALSSVGQVAADTREKKELIHKISNPEQARGRFDPAPEARAESMF